MPRDNNPARVNNALGYLGTLYRFGRRSNTVLRLIGGVSATPEGDIILVGAGWDQELNYEFPTNVDFDLPAPAQPANLEGADAPAAVTEQLGQSRNVVQLFHEAVEQTYLSQSVPGRFSGVQTDSQQSVQPNFDFQIQRKLEKIAQDANISFLTGVYNNPANPAAAALKTRGILTAITTNVIAAGAALTKDMLQDLYKTMIDNGGVQPDQLTLLTNTYHMKAINNLYDSKFMTQSQTSSGLKLTEIYTPFGLLRIALELDMPQNQLAFINSNVITGKYLQVPGKPSALFFETLGTKGSKEAAQLYGQFGIDHGPEWAHGKITGLTVA